MHHTLKIEQPFWHALCNGSKNFEIRFNDRGYQTGDTVSFIENNGLWFMLGVGKSRQWRIIYVMNGYGLKEGYVVLGLQEQADD